MNWTTKLPQPFVVERPQQPRPQTPQAPVYENEDALKLAFAAALLKSPTDPFKAALSIITSSTVHALHAANFWPNDAAVKAEVERLKAEEGELSFLPNKADLARSLWERAHGERTSNDDFTKIARLYAEIMDFVPKQARVSVDAKNSNGATVKVVASDLDEKL